jgi:hypothetical protein
MEAGCRRIHSNQRTGPIALSDSEGISDSEGVARSGGLAGNGGLTGDQTVAEGESLASCEPNAVRSLIDNTPRRAVIVG